VVGYQLLGVHAAYKEKVGNSSSFCIFLRHNCGILWTMLLGKRHPRFEAGCKVP